MKIYHQATRSQDLKEQLDLNAILLKVSYKRRQIVKHKFVRFPLRVIRNVALKEQSDLDTMTIRARY